MTELLNSGGLSEHEPPKFDMKVLLIDDDEDFATGLAILLEKFNIATVMA